MANPTAADVLIDTLVDFGVGEVFGRLGIRRRTPEPPVLLHVA